MDFRWNGFSRCTRASAALVSTKTCSALVGKPQLPHRVLVEFRSSTGEQEKTVGFDEFVRGDTLDPDGSAVHGDLHLPGGDPQLIPQRFRDYHPPGLVNGSAHTMSLPFRYHLGYQPGYQAGGVPWFTSCRHRWGCWR